MNDKYLLNLDERMDDSFTLHASGSIKQHEKVTEYAKKLFLWKFSQNIELLRT